MVVTKGVPPPVMQAVLDAGATDLGENRAQELLAKAPELAGPERRRGTSSGGCSATRWRPWRRWSTSGSRSTGSNSGRPSPGRAPGAAVLAEVNVADDPAKAGVAPDDAPALVDGLRSAGLARRRADDDPRRRAAIPGRPSPPWRSWPTASAWPRCRWG